ncbi:MAG: hypothetical protein APF81_09075 [Desulfosporosinus sp. BRH_c37]|nr:MAG: hypothetical protein APF81_09075 [Desulfosporosinus sp. BRH_c37]
MKVDSCIITRDLLNPKYNKIAYEYLEYLKMLRYKKQTIYTHMRIIYKFLMDQTKDIELLDSNDLQNWLDTFENSTFNKSISILRSFFLFCQDEDYITKIPVKSQWRHHRPIRRSSPKFLKESDVALIQFHNANLSIRDRAIVELLLSTGCGSAEVCNLNIEDINLIRCTAKVTRNRWHQQIISFSEYASILIDEHLKTHPSNENALFLNKRGNRITPKIICEIIHRLGEIAGLNERLTMSHLRNTAKYKMSSSRSMRTRVDRSYPYIEH